MRSANLARLTQRAQIESTMTFRRPNVGMRIQKRRLREREHEAGQRDFPTLGLLPGIGARGRHCAGITMAMRRPHKRMNITTVPDHWRGTSSSPRVVFDRATFPQRHALDSGVRRSDDSGGFFHTNRSCRLGPAHQGRENGVGCWKRVGPNLPHRSPPLWIPAFAGMTYGGRIGECASGGMQPLSGSRNAIFVPIAHAGCGRHTKV